MLTVVDVPLSGVAVTNGRERGDRARLVGVSPDERDAEAEKVVPVTDRPDTHPPASPYDAFPAEPAERLADRLAIHHTPEHGSRLNPAEVEPSALARDLPGRVGDRPDPERHVAAREQGRNGAGLTANWRPTTADARIKLRKLYPTLDA